MKGNQQRTQFMNFKYKGSHRLIFSSIRAAVKSQSNCT
jgi:hypothetical protein